MLRLLIFLFISIPGFCFAQNKISDEEFLNEIHRNFTFGAQNYFLAQRHYKFNISDSTRLKKELRKYISEQQINEMFAGVPAEFENKFWDCAKLNDATCLSAYSLDTFLKFRYNIKLEESWNEEKKAEETEKQKKQQDADRYTFKAPVKCVYYFTQPLFTKNYENALIGAQTCSGFCKYLFKRGENAWIMIAKIECGAFN